MGFTSYTNPYMAGDPVGKEPSFVGREDVLRDVLRVLRHPQQNAILRLTSLTFWGNWLYTKVVSARHNGCYLHAMKGESNASLVGMPF